MSPKFPRKFNGLYKQINIYLWHTKMEYDNFQTIRIEKEEKKNQTDILVLNHLHIYKLLVRLQKLSDIPSLSDIILSYRNSPYVEQSTD